MKIIANGNVNGIDLQHFSPEAVSAEERQKLRQGLGISETDFVFVFVGRLVGDKGINELVTAFKNIASAPLSDCNSRPIIDRDSTALITHDYVPEGMAGVKLLLVGPLETELDPLDRNTLKEIENNPNIITTGFQPDVRAYLAVADALAFPSYREGFPNVVVQAGAMELPAIVTNINGCNEIIISGENGLIIPPKNVDELKDAMLKLLNDQELYNKLKKNARPRIVENYEQSVVWQAILDEYRKVESNV